MRRAVVISLLWLASRFGSLARTRMLLWLIGVTAWQQWCQLWLMGIDPGPLSYYRQQLIDRFLMNVRQWKRGNVTEDSE